MQQTPEVTAIEALCRILTYGSPRQKEAIGEVLRELSRTVEVERELHDRALARVETDLTSTLE